jgi:O-acetyl-ADP-ribose deacetylase (regulator of RNase III)
MSRIEIEFADLTEETTHAVVNAANDSLGAGAGVCGAIHAAGGPEVLKECRAFSPTFRDNQTGEIVSDQEVEDVLAAKHAYDQAKNERSKEKEAAISAFRDKAHECDFHKKFIKKQIKEIEKEWRDGDTEALGERPNMRIHTERCPVGDAKITTAGRMPADYCIHAVGPIWHGGNHDEVENLARVHRRIVEIAAENGCKTVAIPAISTGIYGFPMELAAETAIQALREALDEHPEVELVRFCMIDQKTYRPYAKALGVEVPPEEIEIIVEIDADLKGSEDERKQAFIPLARPVAQEIMALGAELTGVSWMGASLRFTCQEDQVDAITEIDKVRSVKETVAA